MFAISNKLRHKVLVKFINRAEIKNYCHHVGLVTNPFHATGLFLYPLDSSGNLWFSDVFRGYRKRPILWDGSTHIRLTRSWRRSLYIEASSLIYRANHWTGFYMVETSVMKEFVIEIISCRVFFEYLVIQYITAFKNC